MIHSSVPGDRAPGESLGRAVIIYMRHTQKRTPAYGHDAVRYVYGKQVCALIKRFGLDMRDTVGNNN